MVESMNNFQPRSSLTKYVVVSVTGLVVLVATLMLVIPPYSVWSATKTGQAELAQATLNRQIKVQEAESLKAAAAYQADAEVIRAQGVAKANKIIGDSLKDNDAYLRYLWVNALNEKQGDKEIVYVPTEANLPILEAGRSTKGK
jgi:hypothetical protein